MAQQDPFTRLFDTTEDETPFSETEQGRREAWIDEGFTGTFEQLIEWADHALMNGCIKLAEDYEEDPLNPRRRVRRLELVSGGFSTAELAMARLRAGMLGFYWESSHRGGLDVYLVPEQAASSDHAIDWVLPASELVFSAIHARKVVVLDPGAMFTETVFETPMGAEVLYTEDPDTGEAVLTVRGGRAPSSEGDQERQG